MKASNSRREFIICATAAAAALPLVAKGQVKTKNADGFSQSFLAELPQLMEWANVPGLATALLNDGKLSWSRGFGVKKAGESEAVTSETMFGAASLSKPVFTYAILRMRDDKLIDLDRPLWNYLPNEELPEGENAKLITARHVLTHSTGLQNWRFNRDQKLEFAFKPGERFQYSGEGFYYLQRVLEAITGRGFEGYMQERVLKPLGMSNSTFIWNSTAEQRMSWGHNSRGVANESFNAQQGRKMMATAELRKKPLSEWKHEDVVKAFVEANKDAPAFPNFLLPNTAGSLITSVDEYALFMARLMSVAKESGLSETTRREMLSPQMKVSSAISWGLGIGLETYKGRQYFWHWGDNGVFKDFMIGDPASGSGIVVFTNGSQGHRMWQRIVAEAMGRDHPAFYFYMT